MHYSIQILRFLNSTSAVLVNEGGGSGKGMVLSKVTSPTLKLRIEKVREWGGE